MCFCDIFSQRKIEGSKKRGQSRFVEKDDQNEENCFVEKNDSYRVCGYGNKHCGRGPTKKTLTWVELKSIQKAEMAALYNRQLSELRLLIQIQRVSCPKQFERAITGAF